MTRIRSSREHVKTALCLFILDFQKWLHADTASLEAWKADPTPTVVVEGRMVDDINGQLESYRKSGNARLPRLFLAVQRIKEKPDASYLPTIPYDLKTRIPTDPQKRNIKLRALARAFRVQFAFLVNDPDSASSFTDQFSSYIELAEKRRFPVTYEFAPDVKDDWHLTILDNSIYPDSASVEDQTLTIGLLDFTAQGLLPQITAGLDPNIEAWHLVVESDQYKQRNQDKFVRLKADPSTGERTEELLDRGTP